VGLRRVPPSTRPPVPGDRRQRPLGAPGRTGRASGSEAAAGTVRAVPTSVAVPAAPATSAALRLGGLEVWPPVVLAPMAGVTNAAFRSLCRRHGGGLYVSEMVGARGLVEGNRTSRLKAWFAPDEHPRSIQLYATDPADAAAATELLVGGGAAGDGADAASGGEPWGELGGEPGLEPAGAPVAEPGVEHLDLNFGCPAPKVTRHGGGSALPWRTDLYAAIVDATVRAAGDVPVTVKLRLGIDEDHLTYLEAGRIAADLGVAAVGLHARTAEQRYGPPADWSAIGRLVETIDVPVLGNGDVWDASDALRMLDRTGCAGVIVGRGCLGRPWLFRDLQAAFEGRPAPAPPGLGEVLDTIAEHARLLVDLLGHVTGLRELRKHTGWYLQGFPVGRPLRRSLNQVSSLDELDALLVDVDRSLPFDEAVRRQPRGHTTPPRRPVLPHGWLETRTHGAPLAAGAAEVVSGG
jgi:nifR3 family TIM-barrel protein